MFSMKTGLSFVTKVQGVLDRPVTVCEVLRNSMKYNAKVIAVRGKFPIKTALVLVTAGLSLVTKAQDVLDKPVTVCEVLRDSMKYNGKVIAVRGKYLVGGHGLYLSGEDCELPLVTKGYRWPSLIWISHNEDEFRIRRLSLQRAVKAEVDIAAARQRAEAIRPGAQTETITVTYVGLFETHANFDDMVVKRPDGSLVGIGFGQVPGAPGQLFVDSVKDIVVQFQSDPPTARH